MERPVPAAGGPPTPPRKTVRRMLFGAPRDVTDPHVFHRLSLVAFLAWVGLGADGLSSSAYGPEEAYKALGSHQYLALMLIAMTAFTVAVISIAYSNLIQHFPGGGGGYLVATKLLGTRAGVVSGCALLVDYVLTITISIASACDQLWSFLPVSWQRYKFGAAFLIVGLMIIMNLRGIRESVKVLAPVFLLFIGTHAVAILYAVFAHLSRIPTVITAARGDFHASLGMLGFWPLVFLLLRAYSLGGGTYTGIEAVSNGVATLREPHVRTGKRTMALMAVSLAFTAGGILLGYLLTGIRPVEGRTMNAVLLSSVFGPWQPVGISAGAWLVVVSLFAEAALLVVAAQAGFIDGPRVLANMAVDSWMPHRFSQLSDRLVTQNGVFLMGAAAIAALLYTGGSVGMLVVMYSINVFITFTLTELGMSRHWIRYRRRERRWKRQLAIHGTGLVLCVTILTVTTIEKFGKGGWMTLLITSAAITLAFAIRRHYTKVAKELRRLDELFIPLPPGKTRAPDAEPARDAPTAAICVTSFSGFGLHQLLSIEQLFQRHFRNFVFLSAAIVDSGSFKGAEEVNRLSGETQEMLDRYVRWARSHGLNAASRMKTGTEAVSTVEQICADLAREFPRAVFFMGKLIFQREKWHHRFLHNETAAAIQRRLQFRGLQAIVLPIRVLEPTRSKRRAQADVGSAA